MQGGETGRIANKDFVGAWWIQLSYTVQYVNNNMLMTIKKYNAIVGYELKYDAAVYIFDCI